LDLNFQIFPLFHNIDSLTIKNNDSLTTRNLKQAVNEFTTGNPSLSYVNQDIVDGCGLFTTESNGDLTTAYGKICSIYLIAYYSSSLDSSDVTASTAKWFKTTFYSPSDVENGYLHLCGEYLISTHDPIDILDIYTLDSKTAEKDAVFCNQISKIDTSQPALTATSVVAGAIGADSKYQELRSLSNINRHDMVENLKASGAKTLVSVAFYKKYYQHTLK
jgi:hypothetical protein